MDNLKIKLRILRIQWLILWIVPAIYLFVLNKSLYLGNATTEYVLQVVGIAMTVAAIPACYKFFDSKFAQKAIEEAGEKPLTLMLIRFNILFLPIMFNVIFYSMTGSQSFLFCDLLLLLFSFTIWPTEKDCDKIEK